MNDPIKVLNNIEQVIREIPLMSKFEKKETYNSISTNCRLLIEYAIQQNLAYAYVKEKTTALLIHVGAMTGTKNDNGHDEEQHMVWAYGALDALKSVLVQT